MMQVLKTNVLVVSTLRLLNSLLTESYNEIKLILTIIPIDCIYSEIQTYEIHYTYVKSIMN